MNWMKLCRAGACLVALCLQGVAMAEISPETAEALMRKSGMWAQLGDLSAPIKAGLAQSSISAQVSREDLERLNQLADDAFAGARLRDAAQRVLARDLTEAQSADALKWYSTPTGQQITRLEEAASAQFGDQALVDGNAVLGKASAKRVQLLSQIVKATHAAEAMVTMQINTTTAVLQGLANARPQSAQPSVDDMRKIMEAQRSQMMAQRPQMVASSLGVALSLFALTYKSISDKALEQYVRFLSSKSGAALTAVMDDAQDKALSAAAQRLGQGLAPAPGVTNL